MTLSTIIGKLKMIISSPWLWAALFIIAVVPMVLSVMKGGVFGADSAYYLLYVGKISEGYVPYKTIALGYTPLWFYLMYLLSYPFGVTCFNAEYFLVIHYLFAIGNAALITLITKHFSQKKPIALFAGWLYLICSHWLDGHYVLLEIPSLFFGLLSLYLLLKHGNKRLWLYIIYGAIAACSFLVKQFGFGFLLLGLLLILFEKERWQRVGLFILGYAIPIAICFLLWGKDFIPIIFSGYGTTTAVAAGVDTSFQALFVRWFTMMRYFFIRVLPALLLVLFFIYIPYRDQTKIKEWLLCLCGIGGFSLQYRFAQAWTSLGGLHYFQYILPFAVLIVALCLGYSNHKIIKCIYVVFVCFTMGVNVYSTYNNRVNKLYLKPNFDDTHKAIAAKAKQLISNDKTVWIANSIPIYYYGEFTPPNLQQYGYAFGTLAMNNDDTWLQIRSADYVICVNKTLSQEQTKYLNHYKSTDLGSNMTLYDMHALFSHDE